MSEPDTNEKTIKDEAKTQPEEGDIYHSHPGVKRATSSKSLYFGTRKGNPMNGNELRHTWQDDRATNLGQQEWLFDLRNGDTFRRDLKIAEGAPQFPDIRQKEPKTVEREQGPYKRKYKRDNRNKPVEEDEENQTYEKYQNYTNTRHMLEKPVRLGNCTENIDWQLQLRGSMHKKPDMQWKRYYQKSHQSFDLAKENYAKENYSKHSSTPIFTKRDRNQWSVPAVMHREDPIFAARWPGCEGTAGNTWEHLLNDRKHGHKARNQIKWEVTLREEPGWDLGSKLADNRSEGCVAEMLGKKKWHFSVPGDQLSRTYAEGGDVKLHHIKSCYEDKMDEKILALRRHKEPRKIPPSDHREAKH